MTIADQIFSFRIWDYLVLGVMLLISTAIGIYFGFFAKSANTTDEYLMGGKKMKTIPIAISLIASQLSGTAIMTIPGEIYTFGINFAFLQIAVVVALPLLNYVVIPVFYRNNISNCYEYLEKRFDSRIKKFVTFIFVVKLFLVLPIYSFVPSLAFSQVSGMNIHLINTVVCSICVLYTMLGGIKAVVWTDVVQGSFMLASLLVIAVMGVNKVGGFSEVNMKALEGLTIETAFDFTTRTTFWNCFLSGIIIWTSHVGFNQSCVQRIVALPSLRQGRISLVYFAVGCMLLLSLVHYMGLIMFATYFDCDPIKAGLLEKSDKLLPYYVQHIAGHINGMSGFFISSILSAALSTISANLNSLSGIVYFDYIRPRIDHTEEKANFIMKTLVVVVGIYCIAAGVIVQKFKFILQLSMTISGVTFGSLFGVFMLGLLFPKAHSKPVYITLIIGLTFSIVIACLGKIQALKYDVLPTSVEGCTGLNVTVSDNIPHSIHPFDISKLSFQWYSFAGTVFVWLLGVPLSMYMKRSKTEKENSKLLAPIIQKFYSDKGSQYSMVSLGKQ